MSLLAGDRDVDGIRDAGTGPARQAIVPVFDADCTCRPNTTSGAWKYAEYDYVNRAGSFLYEPAGSVHTLECIEDNTHVWFHMYGANLNLDADGNVTSVIDAGVVRDFYLAACESAGHPRPAVIGL